MKDSRGIAALKWIILRLNQIEAAMQRWWLKRRGEPGYSLSGDCNGCGQCCEQFFVVVPKPFYYLPMARDAFLFWHYRVNQFSFKKDDKLARGFWFTCEHYDSESKQCDSYSTRPFRCRDYPIDVLYHPLPELHSECSYSIRSNQSVSWLHALDQANLTEAQREELKKNLHLEV